MAQLFAHGAIRYNRDEDEFLLKCGSCFEFLPLALDFWDPDSGLQTCRDCRAERKRLTLREWRARHRGKETTPQGEGKRAATNKYYARNAARLRTIKLAQYREKRAQQVL